MFFKQTIGIAPNGDLIDMNGIKPDGAYVTYGRLLTDDDMHPLDDISVTDDYVVFGVQAQASISVVKDGTSTSYTITSAGLWGCVVPNDKDPYLDEVYEEELATLKGDLAQIAKVIA